MKKLLALLVLFACSGCVFASVVGILGLRDAALAVGGSVLFATALIWSLIQLSS